MSQVHIDVLCPCKVVSRKKMISLVSYVKKTKFGAKKRLLVKHFFIFFTQDKK
jgi:hypothetical protein